MQALLKVPLTEWQFLEPKSKSWLEAAVPGSIHTDLLRHKLISDPFWGSNERDLQWIADKDWSYQTEIAITAAELAYDNLELVADGLDTLATIRLNGKVVAQTDNMFVGYRFPIKDFVHEGANILEIDFANTTDYISARKKPDHFQEWNDPVGGSSLIRKQQCSFGWDWGPRFATCGIYKAIRLEGWSWNRFQTVQVLQTHSAKEVELTIKPRLAKRAKTEIRGEILLNGKVVAKVENLKATIKDPQLWWPNGHGAQPLYTVKLELVHDGVVIDVWSERIGLRTILLDLQKDEWGQTFQFVVNGRAIFAKGANWIPAHSFVTIPDRAFYDGLLSSAVATHMNMIRVWGGGIYEMDAFYDLCAEKGLLIWQDFMFACALYPGSKEFLAAVKAEAEYQIPRLANHPSLALWCGNNEIEQMPQEITKTPQRKKAYDTIFYKILPEALAQFDGVTAYRPCSPHNPDGYEHGHNNENAGDSHFWDVWHARFPVKRYEEKNFRFCSEFGMQSYSSPEIAATFCKPEDFNIFGPAMENHQKNRAGNLIILDYVSRLYRLPKDYATLSYLGELNQAYCLKFGIEHFRRSMPRTMGALYWQLNDCWPCFSWSSLEFGGRWKALQHASKRFFAPLLVSAHVPGTETVEIGNEIRSTVRDVNLFTVYDGLKKQSGVLSWTLFHLDGRKLVEGEKKVTLAYGQSIKQKTLDLGKAIAAHGLRNVYLRIRVEAADGAISQDTVFLTAPRFLELPKTPIKTDIKKVSDGEYEITCQSENFHHQVEILLPGTLHRVDGNFFDLYPGEAWTVRLRVEGKLAEGALKKKLTLRSLVDSY